MSSFDSTLIGALYFIQLNEIEAQKARKAKQAQKKTTANSDSSTPQQPQLTTLIIPNMDDTHPTSPQISPTSQNTVKPLVATSSVAAVRRPTQPPPVSNHMLFPPHAPQIPATQPPIVSSSPPVASAMPHVVPSSQPPVAAAPSPLAAQQPLSVQVVPVAAEDETPSNPSTPTIEVEKIEEENETGETGTSTNDGTTTAGDDQSETVTAGDDYSVTAGDDYSVGEQELDADLEEPQSKKVWAIVKFTYDTDDSEELALLQDEIIEILEQNDDGWWKGKNSAGKEGIFPHNFVTITDSPLPPQQPSPVIEEPAPVDEQVINPFATLNTKDSKRKSFFKKEKDKDKKKDKEHRHKDKGTKEGASGEGKDDEHSPTTPPPQSPNITPSAPLEGFSASSSLPSSRKLSDTPKTITKLARDLKARATTVSMSHPHAASQQPAEKHLRSSPSMPFLPLFPGNSSTPAAPAAAPVQSPASPQTHSRTPSDSAPPAQSSLSSSGKVVRSTSNANLAVVQPSQPAQPTQPAQENAHPSSPAPAHAATPTSPIAPASPPPSDAPASPTPTGAGGMPESFIMKVHVPPTGSSQVKVSSNQTIAELISTIAKKRSYAAKDCSLRLMGAAPTDPPLDPSTVIATLGTKELRLGLEGESAAALAKQPATNERPVVSSGSQSSNSLLSPSSSPAPASPVLSGRNLKEGFLMKADQNKKLKKVWTILDKNFVYCYKTPQDKNPTEKISLYCATTKGNMDPKKKHMFDLLTVTNTYTFAADNETEATQWFTMIGEACQALIMKEIGAKTESPAPAQTTTTNTAVVDKAEQRAKEQRARELVLQIRDMPDNKVCAECSSPDPDWASINLGIFFCIECSGIHRALGTHISQVRSVLLDFWETGQILTMESIGNRRANEYWEHNIPPTHHKPNPKSSAEEREEWIRNKYQQKLFADPSRTAPGTPFTSSVPPSSSAHQPSPQPSRPLTPQPSRPETPTQLTSSDDPASLPKIPGIDFVGYGFFSFNDDPTRPILRRQARLFKSSFDDNKTSHVVIRNGPPGTRRRGVEFLVPDDYSLDTSSVHGFVPAVTKVFDKKEDYNKFLAAHTHPQLDSYRQTVSLHSDNAVSAGAADTKWWAVTEARVELYELFVNQVDEEGLSPHILKAAPLLLEGDASLLAQFIKKNGTHFVRGATYGGRMLMKSEVEKSAVPSKDEVARLCDLNFKYTFALDSTLSLDTAPAAQEALKVVNYTLDVTGGDNRKRGLDWIDSIWEKPQVLSYELESISTLFDDLALSVKLEQAIRDHMERIKG